MPSFSVLPTSAPLGGRNLLLRRGSLLLPVPVAPPCPVFPTALSGHLCAPATVLGPVLEKGGWEWQGSGPGASSVPVLPAGP